MQNQLLQVKTQVAVALADQHMLEKKQKENAVGEADWMRRADLSLAKGDEALARAALERALSHKRMASSFAEQVEDQKSHVETLKSALRDLNRKLEEARAKADLLLAQHRRSRAFSKAGDARMAAANGAAPATFDRMTNRIQHEEALGQAKAELLGDDIGQRLEALEKEDEVDRLLAELKARRSS
jgi:phage shock protein A